MYEDAAYLAVRRIIFLASCVHVRDAFRESRFVARHFVGSARRTHRKKSGIRNNK